MQYKTFICYLFLSFIVLCKNSAQQIVCVSGVVTDSKTKQPLPFASVEISGTHLGTITGNTGKFKIYIPDSLMNEKIKISYIGYNSFESQVKKILGSEQQIGLLNAVKMLDEVIVYPLPPEKIIQKVIANIEKNYPNKPFISEGFYREEFLENDAYINFAEALVELYNPAYGDTTNSMARIVQGRKLEDPGNIKFLWDVAEKKYNKQKNKAQRKGKDFDTNEFKGIQVLFSPPDKFLLDDFMRKKELHSNKKYLNKFEFNYEPDVRFGDKELIVIHCISTRKINSADINAYLYIDKASYALVKLISNIEADVPLLVKPVLKFYKIELISLSFKRDIEYHEVNGKWYPRKSIVDLQAKASHKLKSGKTEVSKFKGKQAYVNTNIRNSNIAPFKPEERLTNKKFTEQVVNNNPEFWIDKTIIEYSVE
jgi:hypothetical protein